MDGRMDGWMDGWMDGFERTFLLCLGDCTAVIGSLSETDTWLAKKLTVEHNSGTLISIAFTLLVH